MIFFNFDKQYNFREDVIKNKKEKKKIVGAYPLHIH